MKKYWFRISKYNPKYRDNVWEYKKDEWTSITDIWKHNIKWYKYKNTEDCYVKLIVNLLTYFKFEKLNIFWLQWNFLWQEFENIRIKWLWKEWRNLYLDIKENGRRDLSVKDMNIYIVFLLREMLWSYVIWNKIEIHVWYDYYMYILTTNELMAEYLGNLKNDFLYIERIDSDFFDKNEEWSKNFWYDENHL